MKSQYKMSYISDIEDVFKNLSNTDDRQMISIYVNFDNINNLSKLLPKIYNNIPILRTKIITKLKSYDFTRNMGNILLERLLKKYEDINENNMHKLFIITNDRNIKNTIPSSIFLSSQEINKNIEEDENNILFVDINNNINNINNKKYVDIMLFNII